MGALFIGNLSSLTSGFFIAEAKFRRTWFTQLGCSCLSQKPNSNKLRPRRKGSYWEDTGFSLVTKSW